MKKSRRKNRKVRTHPFLILFILMLLASLSFGIYKLLVKPAQIALIGTSAILPASSAYDVVVVGGGASGVAAAIQAARQGVSVALLEETDWLGGQMSAAAVSTMDEGGSDWQRTGGIYGEIYQKTKAHYDALGLTQSTCYLWYTTNCPEPNAVRVAIGEIIADTQTSDTVLDVYTLTKVNEVIRSGNTVTGVKTTEGKIVSGKVVIDATEYGDLLPLSGVGYRIGNKTNSTIGGTANQEDTCIQSITYSAVIKKYPALPAELTLSQGSPDYDANVSGFQTQVSANGFTPFDYVHYPVNWSAHSGYRGMPDPEAGVNYYGNEPNKITKTGVNLANDYGVNSRYLLDPSYRTTQNCYAKSKTIDFIRYAQTEVQQPLWSVDISQNYAGSYNQTHACTGFPESWAPIELAMPVIPYVRESMRLIGMETLGTKNIPPAVNNTTSAEFQSSIAVAAYAFDIHGCNSSSNFEQDLDNPTDLHQKRPFQIPMETLIPETVDGFLAAEKNISQSRMVNGATRLQPTVMAIGQAAGSLAAHSIRLGIAPRHVAPAVVQLSLALAKQRLSAENINNIDSNYWAYGFLQNVLTNDLTPPQNLASSTISSNTPTSYGSSSTVTASTISPDDNVTRGEIAYVLTKSAQLDMNNLPTTPTFTDVPTSHPYYALIEALYRAGITAGCSASPMKFCPDENLTRAQMAVFMVKALGLDPSPYQNQPSSFSDVNGDSAWAAPYIETVYKNGIAAGCGTSPLSYCPMDPLSRAQTWVFATKTYLYKTGESR